MTVQFMLPYRYRTHHDNNQDKMPANDAKNVSYAFWLYLNFIGMMLQLDFSVSDEPTLIEEKLLLW